MLGVVFLFKDMKSILKVASIYMATIIGAGFASGQEIMQFFTVYYEGGFYGIILAGLLFSALGYIILTNVHNHRIRNYEEFLFPAVGWHLGWIMEMIVTVFMGSVLCIMTAGAGSILSDKFNMPFYMAVSIVAALSMMVFLTDIKGIVTISTFITPILIAGIIAMGIYIIVNKDVSVFATGEDFGHITNNWIVSSILYVSYNSITAVVVMCSLLPYLKSKKTAAWGGIIGGLLLCGIAIILNIAIYLFYPSIMESEMPILGILDRLSPLMGGLYSVILLLAMFIAALTGGYGFIERIRNKTSISKNIIIPVICVLTIPMSYIGFSNLIRTIYPMFGYGGLFLLCVIFIKGISDILMGTKGKKSVLGDLKNRKFSKK